jgi:exodeoxyribonuclease III
VVPPINRLMRMVGKALKQTKLVNKRSDSPSTNDQPIKKFKEEISSVLSWNVNGINAFTKKGDVLKNLVTKENPIAVCFQETKLSADEGKYDELLDGYTPTFNICTAKKGYSGTAIYVRNDFKPLKTTFGIGVKEHDQEGRVITMEYETFYLINAYVPNSGQELERLGYRTTDWEKCMFEYLVNLEKLKPIIWTGDLNCAFLDIDVYDPKKCKKVAGFTDEERAVFKQYFDHGLIDVYRHFYPTKSDVFSYYGYRHAMKSQNKGWRLDYFLVSNVLKVKLVDSTILKECEGSDHVPILLKIKI